MKCKPTTNEYYDVVSNNSGIASIKLDKRQTWDVLYHNNSMFQIYRNNIQLILNRVEFDNRFKIIED